MYMSGQTHDLYVNVSQTAIKFHVEFRYNHIIGYRRLGIKSNRIPDSLRAVRS